jgi:methylmalonyl-CoA mutase, N-terminal domain
MTDEARRTDSEIKIPPVYEPADLGGWDLGEQLGEPGAPPFTRGIYPTMYRGRPWTIRQYSGFGSAESTNERWKLLLAGAGTGLSCAFDLPTQMGYDSDHLRAEREIGKVGVAIDSIDDMRLLLGGLPPDVVTTSMTINATAAILLLLYQLVAEEQGVDVTKLGGTVQNDILKEYVARGTYIYPPRPSMRLVTDTFAYCREVLPAGNTLSISGYHIREAGSTAVQEIAVTLANGIAYVTAALDAGLEVEEFAPRLSFFWNAHNNLFEEVAKYRPARRMWSRIMTERFGAVSDRAKMLRFDTQTGGSTLTAQQPENNIVRVTLQSLAAVLGGTQSLHVNSFDDDMGGAVAAIESGYMSEEIDRTAYRYARGIDAGQRVIVGVNRFVDDQPEAAEVFPIDPAVAGQQVARVRATRAARDPAAVDAALADVAAAAQGSTNLLPPMKEALRLRATLGEVSDVLRAEFGEYRPH